MKRLAILHILLTVMISAAHAQINNDSRDAYGNQIDPSRQAERLDSANVEIQSLPPKLYMWRIQNEFGERRLIPADTISHQFQNSNLTGGVTGHYNFLGNLGSPRLSRIFFERRETQSRLFLEPLSSFLVWPTEFNFTNSNVPYTNLTYYTAGNDITGEERFKSYFSVNANKRLAFGFNIDYLYGRGYYQNQATSYFNAALFGSYIGDRYRLQALYNSNYLKTNENGGIADDRYITAPEELAQGKQQSESNNIPTVFSSTTNRNHVAYLFLTHRYNIGFKRDIPKAENDTTPTKQEYVPVTGFFHTLQIERSRRRFNSNDSVADYYQNRYLNTQQGVARDSVLHFGVKNTFGIALLEGFNKYAKAGLTAFVSHKWSKYSLMGTEGAPVTSYHENELYVGGELSKRQGNVLHYQAVGEVGAAGKAIGQFGIKGGIDLNIPLWKDTISLVAHGEVSNRLAPFYMRHYHSKHFWWDDDLEKVFRTRIEGELSSERLGSRIKIGVEYIKNYTYFNSLATPEQYSENLQIVMAGLQQNFRLGIFHLDNEIIWQKTSNSSVLPLPELSFYHNFYIQTRLAKKVLSIRLGADVRYFTRYYAPAYMPAIQQFHLQAEDNRVSIGSYPFVNVYANLHLKRTRFFVMMSHVNQGSGSSNYFLVPHYPVNPRLLQFGLSWNFYD